MSGWVLQDLDLRERGEQLAGLDPRGALFLGGRFAPGDERRLRERGALVFPAVPDVPFDPYRSQLYSPDELYDGLAGGDYAATPDARIYAWARRHDGLPAQLARTLHDLAVDDALAELVQRPRPRRRDGRPRDGARLGGLPRRRPAGTRARPLRADRGDRRRTRGRWRRRTSARTWRPAADDDLDAALEVLAAVPGFEPSVSAWAEAAFEVRRRWPQGGTSLGVPTWFYGHEPPNAFASHVAKYFANAIREDVLLHVCRAGVVFLPGRGGTVQEVFQDACENYYADGSAVAPMVLVGTSYWTEELPVWPLLERLAAGREMAPFLHLVDDLDEVVGLLGAPGRLHG